MNALVPGPVEGELRRRFGVAAVAYALWIASFEAVGFYARTLPAHDLRLPLDALVPYWPSFVFVYELTYALPFVALFVIEDAERFRRALLAIGLASASAYCVYLLVPVDFPRPPLGGSLAERVLALERRDGPAHANHLPSLHVANAFVFYLAARGRRLGRVGNALALGLALAITASTLLVRQHIVLDALFGVLFGVGAWHLAGRAFGAGPRRTGLLA